MPKKTAWMTRPSSPKLPNKQGWPEPQRSGLFLPTGKICGRATGRGRDLDQNTVITPTRPQRQEGLGRIVVPSERIPPMTSVILLAAALFVALCVLAVTLASYALPFMIGLAASRLVLGCGAHLVFAAIVGLAIAASAFASLVYLQAVSRSPTAKFAVAVIYAAPAAVAGHALMQGVVSALQTGEFFRQCLCLASGGVIGIAAVLRLMASR